IGLLGLVHEHDLRIGLDERREPAPRDRIGHVEVDAQLHVSPESRRSTSGAGTPSATPDTTIAATPITRPCASASGPPEFPGARRTSAWTQTSEPVPFSPYPRGDPSVHLRSRPHWPGAVPPGHSGTLRSWSSSRSAWPLVDDDVHRYGLARTYHLELQLLAHDIAAQHVEQLVEAVNVLAVDRHDDVADQEPRPGRRRVGLDRQQEQATFAFQSL